MKVVPAEASAQALHSFHGEIGPSAIRQGRRTVELSPAGALSVYTELDYERDALHTVR